MDIERRLAISREQLDPARANDAKVIKYLMAKKE